MRLALFSFFLLTLAIPRAGQAQAPNPGDLDLTFGGDGRVISSRGSEAFATAVQPDGKVLVGGAYTAVLPTRMALARYNSDGSLDTQGFGTAGSAELPQGDFRNVSAIALQADNKIVVTAHYHNGSNYDFAVIRYNEDGTLDTSFHNDGVAITNFSGDDDIAHAVAVDPSDGHIVVAGVAEQFTRKYFGVARYRSNGSPDLSFNQGKIMIAMHTTLGIHDSTAYALAIQADGKIVVAGKSKNGATGNYEIALTRLMRHLTGWQVDSNGFGTGSKVFAGDGVILYLNGDAHARALAIDDDGKILVAGYAMISHWWWGTDDDFIVARYLPNGQLDTSFGNQGILWDYLPGRGQDKAYAIAIHSDKIFVAGTKGNLNAPSEFTLLRYTADGQRDPAFGNNGLVITTFVADKYSRAQAMALQPDGRVVLAGSTGVTIGLIPENFAVARYFGIVADLQISMVPDLAVANANDTVTYTITVDNPNGPDTASGIHLTADFPGSVAALPAWLSCNSVNSRDECAGDLPTSISVGGTYSFSLDVALAIVGDPVENTAVVTSKEFDPDTANNTATASLQVLPIVCGDSLVVANEACDDGNLVSGDGCSDQCAVEPGWSCSGEPSVCTTGCGDGLTAGAEACDDGNTINGDGCSDSCQSEPGWNCSGEPSVCTTSCGDSVIAGAENCDDGNTASGDGCSDTCQIEGGWNCNGEPSVCITSCGDGVMAGLEACDDGNNTSGDGCSNTCQIEGGWVCSGTPSVCITTCGDGVMSGVEACDDGNNTSADGCSDQCQVEAGWSCSGSPSVCATGCGDGVMAGAEACDDGNSALGDGCSNTCQIEAGWSCSGSPSVCTTGCGDGVMAGAETCDDGNTALGDGCSDQCQVEAGWSCSGTPSVCTTGCGDGVVAGAEGCDDGNNVSSDGCSDTCQIETGCGNGTCESTEDCTTCSVDCGACPPVLDETPLEPEVVRKDIQGGGGQRFFGGCSLIRAASH